LIYSYMREAILPRLKFPAFFGFLFSGQIPSKLGKFLSQIRILSGKLDSGRRGGNGQ